MDRILLILTVIFLSKLCNSQDLTQQSDSTNSFNPSDSLTVKRSSDTLNSGQIGNISDSLRASVIDTSRQVISDVNASIIYSSKDSLIYDFKNKKIFLYDEAKLTYKDLKLEAGRITIDQQTQVLEAYGIPDTVREGKFMQSPLMYQGNDKYEGAKLFYNFKTQQGSVSMGFSDAEIGYYFGDKIKKINNEVLFIKDGLYTTSTDREDPEYYFLSPKMKVIPNDKVIAQSVFLYIEGVPVFWIPFGVFPNRSGRTSGLIPPTFGDDATYGKYLSRLGYFWAINDYVDAALTGSYFTKGRFDLYGRFRYALKYNFNGSIDGGYSQTNLGESTDLNSSGSNNWGLSFFHNHQITPTMRFDANLSFVSGKNYYNTSTNSLNELLQQNIISNVTFSKTWEGTPYSLNLNYYRDQNLLTGDLRERIPLINFAITQTFPFESRKSGYYDKKFYEYFSYSYIGSALNNREKIVLNANTDSSRIIRDMRSGIRHQVAFGFSPKFEYISLVPFLNYTEIWYNKYITKNVNPSNDSLIVNDANAVKALRYFQTGVSLSTKFVGIFSPKVFSVTGIKHTITPAITYFYQPDFSDPKWGYYKTYTDTAGNEYRYSIFEKEVFGQGPAGESQSIALSIGNVFEMKTRVNDTLENKFQLLNLDAGIAYNFAADSLKLSELLTSFRTNIGSFLNISGGATFNFYKYDINSNRRVNQFLIDTDGKLADLTNFNLSMSTSFSFGFLNSAKNLITPNDTLIEGGDYVDVRKDKIDEVSFHIPFSGGFGFNYSESRINPPVINRISNVSGNIAFNLTDKWRFTVSTNYDIVNRKITAPYITAYRDLNSWELNFNWYPAGTYRGFSLEVRIKAPQLRDIKVSKQTNSRGVFN